MSSLARLRSKIDDPNLELVRMTQLPQLLEQIRGCRECELELPFGPRPIVQAGRDARILIVGQAPNLVLTTKR